jgi:hypothetical protein
MDVSGCRRTSGKWRVMPRYHVRVVITNGISPSPNLSNRSVQPKDAPQKRPIRRHSDVLLLTGFVHQQSWYQHQINPLA